MSIHMDIAGELAQWFMDHSIAHSMVISQKRFSGYITVNTPRAEYEYSLETDSIDETVQLVLGLHPSCTSMVVVVSVRH